MSQNSNWLRLKKNLNQLNSKPRNLQTLGSNYTLLVNLIWGTHPFFHLYHFHYLRIDQYQHRFIQLFCIHARNFRALLLYDYNLFQIHMSLFEVCLFFYIALSYRLVEDRLETERPLPLGPVRGAGVVVGARARFRFSPYSAGHTLPMKRCKSPLNTRVPGSNHAWHGLTAIYVYVYPPSLLFRVSQPPLTTCRITAYSSRPAHY